MTKASDTSYQPLTERIREMVESDEVRLPPLPEVATRLGEMLRVPDTVDASAVAKLVHGDPAIAAEILRLANSAAFGGLKPISDLTQAVARLGMNQVGSLVTTLALKGQFEDPDSAKQRILTALWDHAITSAISARFLSIRVEVEAEEAFLAGLLHDVGRLLVLKAVDHLQHVDPDIEVTDSVLEELMDTLHCPLGYGALESWKLPETVCRAAQHHHDGERDTRDSLVVLVQAADAISQHLSSDTQPDPEINLLEHPAIEVLNLEDLELATLMVDVEDEVVSKKSLF